MSFKGGGGCLFIKNDLIEIILQKDIIFISKKGLSKFHIIISVQCLISFLSCNILINESISMVMF